MKYALASLKTNPSTMRFLLVTAICAVALAITHSFIPIVIFYGYGAIYSIVGSPWCKGNVSILSRRVNNHFYIVPSLFGWHSIHLLPAPKRTTCQQIRRSLAYTGDLNGFLPNGRYRVLTHQGVLKRIHRTVGAHISNEVVLGQKRLRSTLNFMTRGRCRRCSKKCAAWNTPPRDWLYVEFEITQGL